jgi:Tol biopolymer transport system component
MWGRLSLLFLFFTTVAKASGSQYPSAISFESDRLPAFIGDVSFVKCAATPNAWHWAYSTTEKNKGLVVVDGVRGKSHQKVMLPIWSTDGRDLCYEAIDEGKATIVLDGNAGPTYEEIVGGPCFADHTNRMAYAVRKGRKQCVVVDGKEGDDYDRVSYVTFSRDGKRFAYTATRGEDTFVVVDGVPRNKYTILSNPSFSPDGRHISFVAIPGKGHGINGKSMGERLIEALTMEKSLGMFNVIDEDADPIYDAITLPTWISNDQMVYSANRGDAKYYVLNHVPHQIFETMIGGPSAYERHLAYEASEGKKDFVVIDGNAQPLYDSVVGMRWSPDGKHFVYAAKSGAKWSFVVDGIAGPLFDHIDFYEFYFTSNSRHWAYWAVDHAKQFIVEDGNRGPEYDVASHFTPIIFSQDGEHLAYIAQKGAASVLILDGHEELQTVGFIQDSPGLYGDFAPFFTTDARHVIYLLYQRNAKECVCVDGCMGPAASLLYSRPCVRSDGDLEFLASGEKSAQELYRVTISFKRPSS